MVKAFTEKNRTELTQNAVLTVLIVVAALTYNYPSALMG
jgi:hypothetical protein